MKTEGIIFDMDGLLIDSEPLWRKSIILNFSQVGIHLTEEQCKITMGYRLSEVVSYWKKVHASLDFSIEETEKNILSTVKQLVLSEGKMMPGALETIYKLKGHFPLALASSSSMELIDAFLERFNLNSYFSVIKSAEFEPYGKPHPAVFIKTANEMNLRPEACVVFEDSFHGLIAAKAGCMKCVAVPDEENLNNPKFQAADVILPSLTEFDVSLLDKI
jgi:mannitol-1-/sugar-/sorbitol-6-/2-deoxyglucose-6-phosphatase